MWLDRCSGCARTYARDGSLHLTTGAGVTAAAPFVLHELAYIHEHTAHSCYSSIANLFFIYWCVASEAGPS